jgi:hypothetical protein
MTQMGRALSILATHHARQEMIGIDLHAFGAPGECYPLAYKSREREEREAMRHARSFSGLNRCQFRMFVRKNMRNIERAMCQIVNRWHP